MLPSRPASGLASWAALSARRDSMPASRARAADRLAAGEEEVLGFLAGLSRELGGEAAAQEKSGQLRQVAWPELN